MTQANTEGGRERETERRERTERDTERETNTEREMHTHTRENREGALNVDRQNGVRPCAIAPRQRTTGPFGSSLTHS